MSESAAVRGHLEYLHLLGQSEVSIYGRKNGLSRLSRALPVPLLEATEAHLLAWRKTLVNMAPETVTHYVCHARQFYDWAIGAGLTAVNPARCVPTPKVGRRLPRPISEEDLLAALAVARPRIRPWLVLAAWVGLRAKEIAYLRRENILDRVQPPGILVAADATKGIAERITPLCQFALGELHLYGLPASGWAFRRCDGQPGPNRPWQISHLANMHLHACGITDTLHQLRHRFGTQTYRAKKDLRMVQELLGHKDPRSTAGYAAYDRQDAVEAVEALPVPRALRIVSRKRKTGSDL